jgi:hypothetical protein
MFMTSQLLLKPVHDGTRWEFTARYFPVQTIKAYTGSRGTASFILNLCTS